MGKTILLDTGWDSTTILNQSVENPGVAFVKGANEDNYYKFFEKNKQAEMYDKTSLDK